MLSASASTLLLVAKDGTSTSPGRSAPSPLDCLLLRAIPPPTFVGTAPLRGGKGSVIADPGSAWACSKVVVVRYSIAGAVI
jgi:hypothetical protein